MRDATDYVRGLVILTVLVGHFSTQYMDWKIETYSGYFIAFFFILSGYGIGSSLDSRIGRLGPGRGLLGFFAKRAARLYPLYWIYFFLDYAFDPAARAAGFSWTEFFLVQFLDPAHKWFLHAIVLCYLLAPVLYLLLKVLKGRYLPALLGLGIAVNIGLALSGAPPVRCLMFLFVYLGNVLLFGFGMGRAAIRKHAGTGKGAAATSLAAALMVASFVLVHHLQALATAQPKAQVLPDGYGVVAPLALYGLIALFTVLFFGRDRRLLLLNVVRKIGSLSLSLYIFEGAYATLLRKAGMIAARSDLNLAVYALFFPFFLLGCHCLEHVLYDAGFRRRLAGCFRRWKSSAA